MSSTTSAMSSFSSSAPTATSTSSGGSSNGPSSPLLFFVALGFGVVFTNLWIIVGVKYCFRYNQRNRQRLNGEDGNDVDLGALPRQHRRRREKKLMTMDEVNEKFPITKYKTWRSSRAEEGLPTSGGINTTSRPASIREPENVEALTTDTPIDEQKPEATHSEKADISKHVSTQDVHQESSSKVEPTSPSIPEHPKAGASDDDDEEDDEHIQTAVPAEQLPDPGDTCAICIDTIEDDDDIRGLHCGHAFHASCVDPWLTSRRACCPLCKADYYVPKPRPEGAEAEEMLRRARGDGNMPAPPQFAFIGGRAGYAGRRPTMVLPGRFMTIVYDERDRYGFPRVVRQSRPEGQENQTESNQPQRRQRFWQTSSGGSRLPNILSRRNRDQPNSTNENAPEDSTTPGQLEAGRS